jgi:hypothetical protein
MAAMETEAATAARVRAVIASNDEMVAALNDDDRAAVTDAIATVRKHRGRLRRQLPRPVPGACRSTAADHVPRRGASAGRCR